MANVVKIKTPKKGSIDTYFIAGDWHTDALHIPTYQSMIKHAKKLPKKKRKLIINGDFLDCPHLMKRSAEYKKWIQRTEGYEEYFIPESEHEYEWGNDVLDQLQKVFSEIIFIEGNHDWRYRDFQKKALSQYAYNFDYKVYLKLKDRGIKWVAYNSWLDIGKLSITHGMYHGTTACKKHYEASGGRSVIFSHVHKVECKPFTARGETSHVWSLPCISDMNPEYIKNSENNWSLGYGVINVKSNGNFNFNIFQSWDNEIVLPCGAII